MSHENLEPCPLCSGKVNFHSDIDEECSGCHILMCTLCRCTFDLSLSVDPANECESLEDLQNQIDRGWNLAIQTNREKRK